MKNLNDANPGAQTHVLTLLWIALVFVLLFVQIKVTGTRLQIFHGGVSHLVGAVLVIGIALILLRLRFVTLPERLNRTGKDSRALLGIILAVSTVVIGFVTAAICGLSWPYWVSAAMSSAILTGPFSTTSANFPRREGEDDGSTG